MTTPRVTVLIAVYNGERFIRSAIDSILNQTFNQFELLIVDDASIDTTRAIIETFSDPRIRIIQNDRNQGAAFSRNRGISESIGEYIAVLDADDIMYPHRLEQQVAFLDAHQEITLVGGAYDVIGQDDNLLTTIRHPTHPLIIKWMLLFRNVIATSTCMFRKVAAIDVGGYDNRLIVVQDYSFLVRLSKRFLLAQLPDVISAYRISTSGLTSTQPDLLQNEALEVSREYIKAITGYEVRPRVMSCIAGKAKPCNATADEIRSAYKVVGACLANFLCDIAKTRGDRRAIFIAALSNLRVIAEQCPRHPFEAFRTSISFGLSYVPECLLTMKFIRFILGLLLSATQRSHLLRISNFLRMPG